MTKLSVAVVGASADRAKFGNKSVRAYVRQRWEVFPVNPKGGEIEGLTVYASLKDVPRQPLDRVTVYLPPSLVPPLLDEVAEVGCGELFLNPGSESDEALEKARSLGLDPITACSIVEIGVSPAELGDA